MRNELLFAAALDPPPPARGSIDEKRDIAAQKAAIKLQVLCVSLSPRAMRT